MLRKQIFSINRDSNIFMDETSPNRVCLPANQPGIFILFQKLLRS